MSAPCRHLQQRGEDGLVEHQLVDVHVRQVPQHPVGQLLELLGHEIREVPRGGGELAGGGGAGGRGRGHVAVAAWFREEWRQSECVCV